MGIDYYHCEICNECIYEGVIEDRCLNNCVIWICDYCLEDLIKEKKISGFDVEDIICSNLSKEQIQNIEFYGAIYYSTKEHIKELKEESKKKIEIEKEKIKKFDRLLGD